MSQYRHLPLILGFLMMTAATGAGQVNTAKPGEPVERHLSGDRTFQEWSKKTVRPTTANASKSVGWRLSA